MSQRKQPPANLPHVSFDEFLSQVGDLSTPDVPIELDSFWEDGDTVYDSAAAPPISVPVGSPLNQALAKSTFLRMAARPLGNTPDVLVVSTGWRYWTASAISFEPVLAAFSPDGQLRYEDWQPVYGDARGLYMGERK